MSDPSTLIHGPLVHGLHILFTLELAPFCIPSFFYPDNDDPLFVMVLSSAATSLWPDLVGYPKSTDHILVNYLLHLPFPVILYLFIFKKSLELIHPVELQGLICRSCSPDGRSCVLISWGESCPPCTIPYQRPCCFSNQLLYLETLRLYRDTECLKLGAQPTTGSFLLSE